LNVRDVASGSLTAIVSLAFTLSCAALIFTGHLAAGLPYGITAGLISMSISALIVALFSPFPRAIAGPDGNAAAVLAAMASAVTAEMTVAGASQDSIVFTVMWSIAIATAINGAVLFFLGRIKAARFLRFLPYPVMGGFVAAAGWLLVVGSVRVGTGIPVIWARLPELASGNVALQLIATVALGLGIIIATSRFNAALALAAMLIASVLIADATFAFLPGGFAAAAQHGWFLYAAPGTTFWSPWYHNQLSLVSWQPIFHRSGELVTVVLVSLITVLVNATAFELDSNVDADFDTELMADGAASLASAAAGGFIGYLSLTRSLLAMRLGATGRSSGITVGVIGLLLVVGGSRIISYVPAFVLGAVLLFLGYSMLNRWVFASWRKLVRLEYAALLLIFIVNVWFGFLFGLIVGLLVGAVLFAFNYSQIESIRDSRSAIEFRSHLMRPPEEEAVLAEHGRDIRVFDLHGFLFFGMADRLYRSVKINSLDESARFIIVDFRAVVGMDSSGVSSFVKIARAAERTGSTLVFSGMSTAVATQWIAGSEGADHAIEHFGDVDHAMEWCEDQIIEHYGATAGAAHSLLGWLTEELGNTAFAERFVQYLEPRRLTVGEELCRQGEAADSMFLIESGRIAIMLQTPAEPHRLRSLAERTMLGEMGLYRHMHRSASAFAERESLVQVLSAPSFAAMEKDDPELAVAFHSAIVRMLANRLSYENAVVSALSR
jgi:SulP family sulfate permease